MVPPRSSRRQRVSGSGVSRATWAKASSAAQARTTAMATPPYASPVALVPRRSAASRAAFAVR